MAKAQFSFRKTDVKRLIEAAAMAGIKVGRVEVSAGKISLVPDNGQPQSQDSNTLDNWIATHADSASGH
jgi:hypothetical protein